LTGQGNTSSATDLLVNFLAAGLDPDRCTIFIKPIWSKREQLLNNPDQLHAIAEKGNEKARKVAQETMQLVRKTMGLY